MSRRMVIVLGSLIAGVACLARGEGETMSNLVGEVERQLQVPYVESAGDTSPLSDVEGFLASGPGRKVLVLHRVDGDFEYDATMTVEREIEMELENDRLFAEAKRQLEQRYGPGSNVYPDAGTGAFFENTMSEEACFWIAGGSRIGLQKAQCFGDGTFEFFVAVTVTPADAKKAAD